MRCENIGLFWGTDEAVDLGLGLTDIVEMELAADDEKQ